MAIKIYSNHRKRKLIYGFELSSKERAEFVGVLGSSLDDVDFFRYGGNVYAMRDFVRIPAPGGDLAGWDAYQSDTSFSGVCVKYLHDDSEHVIVGRYFEQD